MSNSDTKYDVGYKRPPVETRFKPGNKAARGRRRRRPGKSQVIDGLRDVLRQEVAVQRNGKQETVGLGYAIGNGLGREFAQASLPIKLKAFAYMQKNGLLGMLEAEDKLDEERRELEREWRDLRSRERDLRILAEISQSSEDEAQLQLRIAADLLRKVRAACSSEAWNEDCEAQYKVIELIAPSQEEAEQLAARIRNLNAAAAAEQDPTDTSDFDAVIIGFE